jgi:hypothetical protein
VQQSPAWLVAARTWWEVTDTILRRERVVCSAAPRNNVVDRWRSSSRLINCVGGWVEVGEVQVGDVSAMSSVCSNGVVGSSDSRKGSGRG